MKRVSIALAASMVVASIGVAPLPAAATDIAPSDFRHVAAIEVTQATGDPVRLTLSREIIAQAVAGFADLRVFDDQMNEIPYVIYEQAEPPRTLQTLTLEIASYEDDDDGATIIVNVPEPAPPLRAVTFSVSGEDFKKRVRIDAATGTGSWETVADDAIFDFSSRIALRKTSVRITPREATRLRITLRDESAPTDADQQLKLQYEGLEFTVAGARPGAFRIDHITADTGERKDAQRRYDRTTIPNPPANLDEQGNTIVTLGRLNLPVAFITLDVENPYYHRTVMFQVADVDDPDEYHRMDDGVVYRVPGMNEAERTIWLRVRQQPFARLMIFNGDNPPLRVRSVEVGWVRRNLYFVPQPTRTYTLHVGGDAMPKPRYELARLISSDHAALRNYAAISPGPLQANATFAPRPEPVDTQIVGKTTLTIVLVALVGLLGFWLLHLLKRLPAPAGE